MSYADTSETPQGPARVHVVVDNTTTSSDGVHTHTFDTAEDWYEEVYWARILGGLHFHHSLEDGETLGRRVASHVFQAHFRRQEKNKLRERSSDEPARTARDVSPTSCMRSESALPRLAALSRG